MSRFALVSQLSRTVASTTVATVFVALQSGCSMSSLVDTDLPADTNDPAAYNTPDGAIERYRGVIGQFRKSTSGVGSEGLAFIPASGLLSDELEAAQVRTSPASSDYTKQTIIDSRNASANEVFSFNNEAGVDAWSGLHAVRIGAIDAMGALRKYAPNSPPDRIGHLFALQGIAEVMLADLFCSGIPLNTIVFEGKIQYAGPSTSEEVYTHALALFDSALVYAADSAEYQNLARMGRGWALLNLGRYDDAADAVHAVPTAFVYQNFHAFTESGASSNFTHAFRETNDQPITQGPGSVADMEGGNGLPYRSAGDPRVEFDTLQSDQNFPAVVAFSFRKWTDGAPGALPVTIASGVEARLIEAEAALAHNNGSWLTTLNTLRSDIGLGPLADPTTTSARVDTLFKERAFWLYLTGRRLGDMRRLVRQYGRPQQSVFPVGPYPAGPTGSYGPQVNIPVPKSEATHNPNYQGCLNRAA